MMKNGKKNEIFISKDILHIYSTHCRFFISTCNVCKKWHVCNREMTKSSKNKTYNVSQNNEYNTSSIFLFCFLSEDLMTCQENVKIHISKIPVILYSIF